MITGGSLVRSRARESTRESTRENEPADVRRVYTEANISSYSGTVHFTGTFCVPSTAIHCNPSMNYHVLIR